MIEPIILTKYGETLWTHHNQEVGNELLPNKTGIHAVCNGWVDTHPISTTHKAIVCRNCYMRFLVPASVKTYGDLRSFFEQKIKASGPRALDSEYHF